MGSRLPSRLLQHANATQLFQTDCRHSSWGCSVFLRDIKHQVTHTRYITAGPAGPSVVATEWTSRGLRHIGQARLVWAKLPILTGIQKKKSKTENASQSHMDYGQNTNTALASKFPCPHLSLSTQKCSTKDPYPHDTTKNAAIIMPDH